MIQVVYFQVEIRKRLEGQFALKQYVLCFPK